MLSKLRASGCRLSAFRNRLAAESSDGPAVTDLNGQGAPESGAPMLKLFQLLRAELAHPLHCRSHDVCATEMGFGPASGSGLPAPLGLRLRHQRDQRGHCPSTTRLPIHGRWPEGGGDAGSGPEKSNKAQVRSATPAPKGDLSGSAPRSAAVQRCRQRFARRSKGWMTSASIASMTATKLKA